MDANRNDVLGAAIRVGVALGEGLLLVGAIVL